ncbi:tRNA (uracil-5-)-methyltransferase [Psychromonas ingrahamii 37]|uniref:tRNA/tmRNA (uracil-C(5))-methyltransferase n=1 Tax=Psychromonas ingrahamii (strain DSM 17664 / CCUG 51855 / 37) TaxID=357804 RepID=TRMA_PSYIN|nr:tRNA (uridine(54)-C5)-methyltransferase TrmA [Psychromonas ingrahamii]A1SSL6.1 RecName: Full=tRNA/tmRNA (uracil-C(5))-methyltransferase; AltName: Full=tRNA (uracil(54)-C(5))-methyltransferase; AltName: Full=tRNA(m5U54)-methyltransferase; Short=RUMT; AltName: Full=tmRNA (uracil(341)-C(5))-methyltransferase [Psychromonas ingrahamii 37]ABM02481.1 tRNA (uracil-5-)-methyltransferase [Psychromonas ingrahamii 37]
MTLQFVDPENYETLLAAKKEHLNKQFAIFNPPALECFASPKLHYRMRAELRVWHDGDELYYIMFDKKTKQKFRVEQFPPASELINNLMPVLLELVKSSEILRYKLFQIDFLSNLKGQVIVSLLYHKQLDDNWLVEAKRIKAELLKQFDINFIGRARKQKILLDYDYVIEELQVDGNKLFYQQIENSFTQPNAKVCEKMLEWAIDCTRDSQGDLLELYCGNGNFSLALAKNFNKVLATEIAKPSVESAQFNMAQNGINNVTVIRMSAEEFTQAINGEREFYRLKEITLSDYQCNTILVDPPRSGLDDETVKMVQHYDNILYISCNADTLSRNLEVLSKTHEIKRFALFDQFPYTYHSEAGVYLVKR